MFLYIKCTARYYIYSSSNAVLFISGKSNNSETVISRPIASLWRVFSLGFFVLPDIIFSTVLWVKPLLVANLLTVVLIDIHLAQTIHS